MTANINQSCTKCKSILNVHNHVILNIKLCEVCCDTEQYKLITLTNAKTQYKLKPNDFKNLEHAIVDNPYSKYQSSYLYYLKDVLLISNKYKRKLQKLYDNRLKERQAQLIKYKAHDKNYIDTKLYDYVITDFLDVKHAKSKKGIRLVIKELNACFTMTKYNVPKNIYLIDYFIKYKSSPEASKAGALIGDTNSQDELVCRRHVWCVIQKALDKTELIFNAFNQQTLLIASFLGKNDINNFEKTFNLDILQDINETAIKNKISQTVAIKLKIDINKANNFIKIFSNDLEKTYQYFLHPLYGIDATINKIINIYNKDNQFRKNELENEFKKYQMIIRKDSQFCQSYINGKILNPKEEIAAVMRLTNWLFSFSYRTWSKLSKELEDKLRILVLDKLLSWEDAFDNITSNKNIIKRADKTYAPRRNFYSGY